MALILPNKKPIYFPKKLSCINHIKQNNSALHYIMFTFSDPEVEEHKPSTSGTKYSAPSTSKINFEDSDDSVPIF